MFITSKELDVIKPNSEFFEGITQRLSLNTSEICMVGNDYNKDIVGAKNTGMMTIFITTKKGDFPCVDYIVPSFGKIANILCTS